MQNKRIKGFIPVSVTLEDMLEERENRAAESSKLIDEIRNADEDRAVICMTMNFVGEYKQLALSHSAFVHHFKLMQLAIPCEYARMYSKKTGDTAYFKVKMDPRVAKQICVKIEDNGEIGRLFDIDVFGADGEKISRDTPRKCLICAKPAAECSRSRAHGVEAVRKKTEKILRDFFAQDVASMALAALRDELDTTPKPGLVDRNNSGANPDMSYDMFIKSAEAVAPYMGEIFSAAAESGEINSETAERIRAIGMEAERMMYIATGGINTHKGAIYSMGLLSAGAGFALAYGGKFTDMIDVAAQLALELSYDIKESDTHGLRVCEKYGVTGARGEAIGGFKTVLYAFERIKHYADDCNLDTNIAYPLAINDVMAVMKDTNVLHRGGLEGLEFLNKEAREIGQMRMNQCIDDMLELDEELIKRNISPGGCADALACALFLIKMENMFPEG